MSSQGEQITHSPVPVSGPVTADELSAELEEFKQFLSANRAAIASWGDHGPIAQNEDDHSLLVWSQQLEEIFGNARLVLNDKLLVDPKATDETFWGRISGSNGEFRVSCEGVPLTTIQLYGIWAGTVTFEGTSNGGDWTTLAGVRLTDGIPVQSTTGNGIFRFNTGGLQAIRVRFSTATSGTVQAHFRLSHLGNQPFANVFSYSTGAGYLQTTSDYQISSYLLTPSQFQVASLPHMWKVAPTSPDLPTSYVSNFQASLPQFFRRLRAEIYGDKWQPFAQQPNTNELKIVYEEGTRWLEKISYQLTLLTLLFLKAFPINLPEGWEIIGETE
jgi:hypothetical protein